MCGFEYDSGLKRGHRMRGACRKDVGEKNVCPLEIFVKERPGVVIMSHWQHWPSEGNRLAGSLQ